MECFLQVQCIGRHGGAGGLDLAPEVLGLVDEEAIAVRQFGEDVLLEAHDFVVLAVLVRVGHVRRVEVLGRGVADHAGPLGLARDGRLDAREDGVRGEQVHAAVNQVGDVALGLLDVVQHAFRVRVRHDAPEVRGRVVADPRAEDDGFGVLLLEELEHGLEREGAADVRVEDEEPVGAAFQDGIAEVVQTAGRAERPVLAQVGDLELGELSG